MTMTVTQTRNEAGFSPCTVCGKQSLDWWPYPGGTCSQECVRTLVVVEVGRELLKLLRVMSFPTYSIADDRGLPTGQVGPRHSWPAAEPAPHPTDQEPSPPATPKPSWWDKADY